MYDVGMNLLDGEQREFFCGHGGLEKPPVFEDIFAAVPVHETEIQDPLACQRRDSPSARAETMYKPGELLEGRQVQNLHVAGAANGPGERNRFRRRRSVKAPSPGRAAGPPGCFRCSQGPNSIIARCSRMKPAPADRNWRKFAAQVNRDCGYRN